MKELITIIFFLVTTNIFGQETIYLDKDWKKTDKENASYYRQIFPSGKNFIVKDYFMDGQLQFEGISSSNKNPLILEGQAIWYNKDGIIIQKGSFEKGFPNGEFIFYYSNGAIKRSGTYILGELEGTYTEYFPTGEIRYQVNFSKNLMNGIYIKYKSPNHLDFKVNYKNGLVDGPYEFYNSNGSLLNKGNAKNGIQDGKCFEYYHEGGLRKEYTIKDGYVDGKFTEYNREGKITTKGFFDMGKVISFESTSLRTSSYNKFSCSMTLKDGIEEWKIFRDGKLIVKSYYKNAYKTGKWEVFNYNGSELYQIIKFKANSDCKDVYLQRTKKEFSPFLLLSERFYCGSEIIELDNCNGATIKQVSKNKKEHPFYYYNYKENAEKSIEQKVAVDNRKKLLEYKESANDVNFLLKNNCKEHPKYKDVTVCTKEINRIVYKVFLSENTELLKELRLGAKPKDNEIYFYYQKFDEKKYDLDKEKPNRYMEFRISKVLGEALNDEILDDTSIIRVFEHKFWNVGDFSGTSAYMALKKELDN